MKSINLIVSTIAFGSVALGSTLFANPASALENRIGLRSECGSSFQNVTGTTKSFTSGTGDSAFKDMVTLPDNGGTKLVTGTEHRVFSSETALTIVGGSKATYMQMEGFVEVK
jgi:hypothetical protein